MDDLEATIVDIGKRARTAARTIAPVARDKKDAALRAFGGYGWITDTATIVQRFAGIA